MKLTKKYENDLIRAMRCAESGKAFHWPTIAEILADEIKRLRELVQPNFNGMSPAETERIAILVEECGEVAQVVGKILRHGYESCHPNSEETNREDLEKEVGHIQASYEMMTKAGDIQTSETHNHAFIKTQTIGKWVHHQD